VPSKHRSITLLVILVPNFTEVSDNSGGQQKRKKNKTPTTPKKRRQSSELYTFFVAMKNISFYAFTFKQVTYSSKTM